MFYNTYLPCCEMIFVAFKLFIYLLPIGNYLMYKNVYSFIYYNYNNYLQYRLPLKYLLNDD